MPRMSQELTLTFLLGPLVFFILCFFLGLFTPGLNHGSHRFLGLFRIFKFLHGGGSPDLTALLRLATRRMVQVQRKGPPTEGIIENWAAHSEVSFNKHLTTPDQASGRQGAQQAMDMGSGKGRPLTGGAAESHSGNRRCHSAGLEHSAAGSLCGTCLETAGARHLSTCLHMSALGSSENRPVSGKEQSQQIRLHATPERREATSTQASRLAKPLAGVPDLRGSQALDGARVPSLSPSLCVLSRNTVRS